jgi:hypothetical protein
MATRKKTTKKKGGSKSCEKVTRHKRAGKTIASYGRKRAKSKK